MSALRHSWAEQKKPRQFKITVEGVTRFVASHGETADVTLFLPAEIEDRNNKLTRELPIGGMPLADVEWLATPLKVGDTIEGKDAYAACPVGTVVANSRGYIFRTNVGWRASDHTSTDGDYGPGGLSIRRTVAFLPPEATT